MSDNIDIDIGKTEVTLLKRHNTRRRKANARILRTDKTGTQGKVEMTVSRLRRRMTRRASVEDLHALLADHDFYEVEVEGDGWFREGMDLHIDVNGRVEPVHAQGVAVMLSAAPGLAMALPADHALLDFSVDGVTYEAVIPFDQLSALLTSGGIPEDFDDGKLAEQIAAELAHAQQADQQLLAANGWTQDNVDQLAWSKPAATLTLYVGEHNGHDYGEVEFPAMDLQLQLGGDGTGVLTFTCDQVEYDCTVDDHAWLEALIEDGVLPDNENNALYTMAVGEIEQHMWR